MPTLISYESKLGRYDRIDKVAMCDNWGAEEYQDCYILTGDNVPYGFDIDCADLYFNEYNTYNATTVARLNDISDLYRFLSSIGVDYRNLCPAKNTLLVGGEGDYIIMPDLSFGWVPEKYRRKFMDLRRLGIDDEEDDIMGFTDIYADKCTDEHDEEFRKLDPDIWRTDVSSVADVRKVLIRAFWLGGNMQEKSIYLQYLADHHIIPVTVCFYLYDWSIDFLNRDIVSRLPEEYFDDEDEEDDIMGSTNIQANLSYETGTDKYNRIDKVDLCDENGAILYKDCYLLTGDGIYPELEVDLFGDFCFNTEFDTCNRTTIAAFDDIYGLYRELDHLGVNYKGNCPTKDTLLVGGSNDKIIVSDLTTGWIEDGTENRLLDIGRNNVDDEEDDI